MSSQAKIEDLGDTPKRATSDKGKSSAPSQTSRRTQEKTDKDLRDRLVGSFERIATTLRERGDDELAEVFLDESGAMANGLVSFTRFFKPLRAIVLLLVAVAEPVLAFGKVVRVLAMRWRNRQLRKQRQADETRQGAGTQEYVT